jgi:hypothetical protein
MLSKYKWAKNTDIENNVITNKDAVVLLLASGLKKTGELQKALRKWREDEKLWFVYLWNSYYGHVAVDTQGTPSIPFHLGIRNLFNPWVDAPKPLTPNAWWYRTKRGEFALTTTGWRRLDFLKNDKSFAQEIKDTYHTVFSK